jgi:Smg-4/UPF3 family
LPWKIEEEVSVQTKKRAVFIGATMMVDAISRLNRENIHSRAYIAFKTEELVARFSREYDGHTFRDKAGVHS